LSAEVVALPPLETPVVLIVFNRPNETRKVFHEIAKARPSQLFIISDGPRLQSSKDEALVKECREIVSRVNWECEVSLRFSASNLGCRVNVASGLSWVFGQVDRAIILEDDCVPAPDFFYLCQTLLEMYRENQSVGSISGSNLDASHMLGYESSYYASKFPSVWGWATWKRVWDEYTPDLNEFTIRQLFEAVMYGCDSWSSRLYWLRNLLLVRSNKIDTWDYQLVYAHWRKGCFSLISNSNLVSNIGFGPEATHTVVSSSVYSKIPLGRIGPAIIHPSQAEINAQISSGIGESRFRASIARTLAESMFFAFPQWLRAWLQRCMLRLRK